MEDSMKLPSMQYIVQDSRRTIRRFPLACVCALLSTVIALILVDYEDPARESILYSILFAAVLGFPLLTTIPLVAQKRPGARCGRSAFRPSPSLPLSDMPARSRVIFPTRRLSISTAKCFCAGPGPAGDVRSVCRRRTAQRFLAVQQDALLAPSDGGAVALVLFLD